MKQIEVRFDVPAYNNTKYAIECVSELQELMGKVSDYINAHRASLQRAADLGLIAFDNPDIPSEVGADTSAEIDPDRFVNYPYDSWGKALIDMIANRQLVGRRKITDLRDPLTEILLERGLVKYKHNVLRTGIASRLHAYGFNVGRTHNDELMVSIDGATVRQTLEQFSKIG